MVSKEQYEYFKKRQSLKELDYLRIEFLNNRNKAYKKGISRIIIDKWTNLISGYLLYKELCIRFKYIKYKEIMESCLKKLEDFELKNRLGE